MKRTKRRAAITIVLCADCTETLRVLGHLSDAIKDASDAHIGVIRACVQCGDATDAAYRTGAREVLWVSAAPVKLHPGTN